MKLFKHDYDESYHDVFWYREKANSQRNQARLALVCEQAPGGRLLEVGCGHGGFLHIAEKHYAVEGIDISHSAIRTLTQHFGERVRTANIEQQPQPRSSYHAIVAFNILEHLNHPEKAVARLYDALEPGGKLFGSVPNNQSAVGRTVTALTNIFDRTHVSTFTPPTWRRIFEHAGFAPVDFFGEMQLGRNHCRYLRGRWWPHVSFNLMFICHKPEKRS